MVGWLAFKIKKVGSMRHAAKQQLIEVMWLKLDT
jgi:hypothetical protein